MKRKKVVVISASSTSAKVMSNMQGWISLVDWFDELAGLTGEDLLT